MQPTDGFDFPAGKPDGAGYWIASGLAEEEYYKIVGCWHTGEDWNRGSRDADLGDPVYSIAHGQVNVDQSRHSSSPQLWMNMSDGGVSRPAMKSQMSQPMRYGTTLKKISSTEVTPSRPSKPEMPAIL